MNTAAYYTLAILGIVCIMGGFFLGVMSGGGTGPTGEKGLWFGFGFMCLGYSLVSSAAKIVTTPSKK